MSTLSKIVGEADLVRKCLFTEQTGAQQTGAKQTEHSDRPISAVLCIVGFFPSFKNVTMDI